MALDQTQQIFETWNRANRVLVAFREDPKHDGAASALALGSVLKKIGKEVAVVGTDWQAPQELQFLPEIETIQPHIENVRRFVLEVDLKNVAFDNLTHEITDNKLRISLTPKTGSWRHEDVSTKSDAFHFDLICTIGTPDLESLGTLFEEHADFFYHTPIVNIDHDPANEHYGQINHVDINATACGEVLFDLCTKLDRHFIDEHVATCMLTGMISKTRSFKTANVTPKTLQVASELVAIGARREDIVHHLWRNRTVPVLRLWGRALARLKHDVPCKLVWTLLSRQDFIHAGADDAALHGVIDELIVNAPDARCALILYENPETSGNTDVVGILHTHRPLKARELGRWFGPSGNDELVRFTITDRNLLDAERLVTNTLKDQLQKLPA